MKYKCLETFSVPEWDEFENCEEGREFIVHEGSIWKSDNPIAKNDQEVKKFLDDSHTELFLKYVAKILMS